MPGQLAPGGYGGPIATDLGQQMTPALLSLPPDPGGEGRCDLYAVHEPPGPRYLSRIVYGSGPFTDSQTHTPMASARLENREAHRPGCGRATGVSVAGSSLRDSTPLPPRRSPDEC